MKHKHDRMCQLGEQVVSSRRYDTRLVLSIPHNTSIAGGTQ